MSKDTAVAVAGFGFLFTLVLLWLLPIMLTLYGALLAFSASVVLGLCFFLFPPLFTLSGALQLFFSYNLPQQLLEFITQHAK